MRIGAAPSPGWGAVQSAAPGILRLPDLPVGWGDAARRTIDTWVADGMHDPEMEDLTADVVTARYEHVSYGDRRVRRSPVLQRCVSHYLPAVTGLLGPDTIIGDLQLALRFPGQVGTPHLDGMYDPDRLDDPMVPVAVLGIYLGSVTDRTGPLAYWPRSRSAIIDYGNSLRADPDLDRERYRALLADVTGDPPELMTGGPGTAFLFAGWMPHCNLLHGGNGIRYAIYFRFYHRFFYPDGTALPNRGRAIGILAGSR